MAAKAQDQIAFYLTGRLSGTELQPLDQHYLPALFGGHLDLTSLRYDFPLVLNTMGGQERALLSLSGLVDKAVETLQEDSNRDRIARHGYQLEQEIRRELAKTESGVAATGHGDFATLWNSAASRLAPTDQTVPDSAKRLWTLFQASGELVDVSFAMPTRAARHVWSTIETAKAKAFREQVERLLLTLHGILEAEAATSDIGRAPERLKASVGVSFAAVFDFKQMSHVLLRAKPGIRISDDRRNRIEHLIDVLEHQRFFPVAPGVEPYQFMFYRSADALQAYKARREEAVELLKAIAMAKLEVRGQYRESNGSNGSLDHSTIFEDFGFDGTDPHELAKLPSYLVCKYSSELDAEETLHIVEALSTGLPIKVLMQTDDLFESSGISQIRLAAPERHLSIASRSRFLLDSAIGLNDVFVLQSSASQLFALRDSLIRGFSYNGPAFLSVYSGATSHTGRIPAYLIAAAATESRAFPSLSYDTSSGLNWSARFAIERNPNVEDEWVSHRLEYEGESLQMQSETLYFTLADFIAMDDRFRGHFAIVPKAAWNAAMISVPEATKTEDNAVPNRAPDSVPSITLVNTEGQLVRAIVDRRILQETERSQNLWKSLQELGGIHNSYAERAAERAAASFELQLAEALQKAQIGLAEPTVAPARGSAATVTPGDQATTEVVATVAEEKHGDDPYIETARCTSCNECTQVNSKMFAYNAEKQAQIADPDAGTYRQLVEAAEGCQVSIIHPGKPRNPKEPGLDELLKRAAPFN